MVLGNEKNKKYDKMVQNQINNVRKIINNMENNKNIKIGYKPLKII